MTQRNAPIRLPSAFYWHLGVFVLAGLGLAVLTLAANGEFWWYPLLIMWGLGVAGHGAVGYWEARRDRWEVAFTSDDLSPEQREEREFNSAASGFTGSGAGGMGI